MAIRRERSRDFGIGKPSSSHILDLREKMVRESLPRVQRKPKANLKKQASEPLEDALLQEMVLRELAKVESHDIQLASNLSVSEEPVIGELADIPRNSPRVILARGLTAQSFVPQNDELVSKFFTRKYSEKKPESFRVYVKDTRVFIAVAALTAGFLFGGFFINRGLVAKEQSMSKGLAAYANLASARDALKEFNFSAASKDFTKAYDGLVAAEDELGTLGAATLAIVKNIPFESRADSAVSLLTAAKHVAKAGEFLSEAFTLLPLEDTVSAGAFLGALNRDNNGQAGYLMNVFDAFYKKLVSAETELLAAEKAISKIKPEDFSEEFRDDVNGLSQKVPQLLGLVRAAKDYVGVSSLLFGKEGPKRYLILFQNSSELRASGGFIGTYALIEFENGELKNMLVEGIYEADGQLAINIVPPKQFQHIATAWSTHDANWFLDFPTSAQKIAWFFERTGAGKVDGVMTLSIEVLERLLELTGPIELKDYGLTLDAKNFRDEIQYEVEVAYDKKFNRPKKILADFTPIFLKKLLAVSKEKNKELAEIFIKMLEEKYMMFYFTDERLQKFFTGQGWSGAIHETSTDFLSVVHSNIGGYKTDKYTEDGYKYGVEIKEDGSVIGTLLITRKHNGGDSKYWWYNRKNIDYVKIYAPKGAEILSSSGGLRREPASLRGEPDDQGYKALGFTNDADILRMEQNTKSFGPIDIFEESGKTVFGTWLVTNAHGLSELKINYKLPRELEFNNGVGKYNLYWQKQPGTKVGAQLSVSAPEKWEVAWTSFEAEDFALDKDRIFGYIFKK